MQSQENETIDVLQAAGLLGVEKRRIYDITNALMGANVLQKQGKSHYKWVYVFLFPIHAIVEELYRVITTKSKQSYFFKKKNSRMNVPNWTKSSNTFLTILKQRYVFWEHPYLVLQ